MKERRNNERQEGINRSMSCSYRLMPDVYERLKAYDYPGNVRELRNILFIAATHSHNREINAALIDNVMNNMPQCRDADETRVNEASHVASSTLVTSLPDAEESKTATLKDVEELHIRELLDRYQGNRQKVADALGISVRTMYRKLKSLGIN